jgi:hypothetical protein
MADEDVAMASDELLLSPLLSNDTELQPNRSDAENASSQLAQKLLSSDPSMRESLFAASASRRLAADEKVSLLKQIHRDLDGCAEDQREFIENMFPTLIQ